MAKVVRSNLPYVAALAAISLLPSDRRVSADPAARPRADSYSSSRIVVQFAPKVLENAPATRRLDRDRAPGAATTHLQQMPPARAGAALRNAWNRWSVIGMRPAFGHTFRRADLAARHGLERTFVIEVPEGTDTGAMAAAFAALDQVEFAEVDTVGEVAEFIPNDAIFYQQWGLHNTGQTGGLADADIDAPEAWALHTGDPGTVIVAIVDTGVDRHTEFVSRMVEGINTTNEPYDGTGDGCGHGTHVAGIVAAAGNNGTCVAGVTWGAYIMPVRVFDGCTGYANDLANGITWAVDHGADVLNISLQFCFQTTPSSVLRAAVDYAYDSGVLVVGAAGNNNYCSGAVTWPARFDHCMAVSGTNDDDEVATSLNTRDHWSSNYGPEIDVCAPGDHILSTTYTSSCVTYKSGTSMSTPLVSGLAALLKSYVPTLTHDDLWTIISETADDRGPVGWDEQYGYGRINAYSALISAGLLRIVGSSPPDGAIDARQPSAPDGSDPAGWLSIDLLFGGEMTDISEIVDGEYAVTQEGGEGPAPSAASITPIEGEDRWVRVVFDRAISVQAWTTITHVTSGTSVRLGYLPADVNADRTSAPADILRVIDALNGVINLPIWSTDVDRSGVAGPPDILRVIDLLNGAGAYEPCLNVKLP